MSDDGNIEGAFVGHIEDGVVAVKAGVVDGRRHAEAEIVTGLAAISVSPAQLNDLVAVLDRLPGCSPGEQINGAYWSGALSRGMLGLWTGETVRTAFGFANPEQLATFTRVVKKAQQLVAELLSEDA